MGYVIGPWFYLVIAIIGLVMIVPGLYEEKQFNNKCESLGYEPNGFINQCCKEINDGMLICYSGEKELINESLNKMEKMLLWSGSESYVMRKAIVKYNK